MKTGKLIFTFYLFALTILLSSNFAVAEPERFLRMKRDESGSPSSMDTAIVSYRASDVSKDPKELNVDLVAAVHVGEPEYYALLNKRFKQYDAVLYELIMPEDTKTLPASEDRAPNPISAIQNSVKDLLGLKFQLDEIDYRAAYMVHADLTAQAFAQSMSARGESLWTLFMRLIVQGVSEEQQTTDPGEELRLLFGLLVSGQSRQYSLRRYIAMNFQNVEGLADKIEGPSGSAIIADRNTRAVDVLAEQIAKGKKNIAIFYGAAHMPDMEARLGKRFNLLRKDIEWITAWRLQSTVASSDSAAVGDTASPVSRAETIPRK